MLSLWDGIILRKCEKYGFERIKKELRGAPFLSIRMKILKLRRCFRRIGIHSFLGLF